MKPGTYSAMLVVAASLAGGLPVLASQTPETTEGARLAHEVAKGNCLACHAMPGDASAITSANIGPPLVAIRSRFPDRNALRRQIWDARLINPDTVMPPFGKNSILTSEEIELIVDYLYTL